jgi:hypothetical protein
MKNHKQTRERLHSRRHLAQSPNHSNQRTLVTWETTIANVTIGISTTLITKELQQPEKDGNVCNHGNHGIKETIATI